MSKFNYQPLGDKVILEQQSAEQVTKTGIVLPDTAQEKPQRGTVVAVGQGRVSDEGKVIPMNVKVGDVVLYARYGGAELKVEGKEYLILKESDILAVKK